MQTNNHPKFLTILAAGMIVLSSPLSLRAYTLPDLPPMPATPPPMPANSMPMGDPANFPEVKMDFPIETNGPFQPTWQSIASNNTNADNGAPAWLRQAKFGMWVHYGPQSEGASGDWYAQHMYQQGSTAYNNHLAAFGYPATNGYKDVIRAWNPTNYNPAGLAQLYYNAGARFVLVQGVHHDNFDNWNSHYNPWNEMNFGPKHDTLAEWTNACRTLGMHYGVAFHHEYSWWFYQPAFLSDSTGPFAGVPYDAVTATNSAGQWWTNYDTSRLYNIDLHKYQGISTPTTGYWNPAQGIFTNDLDYCNWYATQWALRIIDVIENYDPDFIYTDGDSTQPFSGYATGTGYKCDAMERVIAHYFNRTLERHGKLDTFAVVKFHPGDKIVTTAESSVPSGIVTSQAWIGELAIGDWFWKPGISYDSGGTMVDRLLECVSRDGSLLVNIAPRPDGSLDSGATNMLAGFGQWMATNSEGIYGSRAWVKYGDGSFRFTVGTNGFLYAYYEGLPSAGTQLTIPSLATTSNLLVSSISSVSLLGSGKTLSWSQTATGLVVTCPSPMPSLPSGTAIGFKIGPASAIGSAAPTGVIALPGTNQINLSWNYPTTTATFAVKRSMTHGGSYITVATNLTGTFYADTNAAAGTLYFYVVSAVDAGGPSINSAETSASLVGAPSSQWLTEDIGAVGATGSFGLTNSVFTIQGSGADIWNSADEFRYGFQALVGDCSITARVLNMQNTAPWAKAGVMIRETLDAASKDVINFISPVNGVALQQRAGTGGSAAGVSNPTGIAAPYWLRLARVGDTFTAYYSPDGVTWSVAGTTTVGMNSIVYVGLEVCSVNDGTLCQAQFDNVTLTSGSNPVPPSNLSAVAGNGQVTLSWNTTFGATGYNVKRSLVSGNSYIVVTNVAGNTFLDTGLANGTNYYYVVSATNSAGESANSSQVNATPAVAGTTTNLLWQGSVNANWDINTTANWLSNGVSSVYQDGNLVQFDDAATGSTTVNLAANVSPGVIVVNNSALTYTINSSSGFGIGGTASLTKTGTGTLTLATADSYSGGTTVGNGTIQQDSATAAGTGAITNYGVLNVNIGGNTLANAITGTGAINVIETAATETVLGGNMSGFTGTINIPASSGTSKTDIRSAAVNLNSAATINITDGGTLFMELCTVPATIYVSGTGNSEGYGAFRVDNTAIVSGNVILQGNTTIGGNFNGASVSGISGVIDDNNHSYGISSAGAGTQTEELWGANTYHGATTWNRASYSLILGNGSALQNSTLNYTAGTLRFDSAVSSNAFTFGGLTGTANVNLTNTAGTAITLSVGKNNGSTTYSGVLSGSGGLTKIGGGTFTLNGASIYSGLTSVSNGELVLATSFAGKGNFLVGDGATLGVTNLFTSSASMSNLTLGVSGPTTLEFLNVSNLAVALLAVSNLVLGGICTVKITGSNYPAVGNTYPLVNYAGTFTGNFSNFNLQMPTGTAGTLVSNAHQIALSVIAAPTTPTNLTAVAGDGQVTLAWSASANATGYNVKSSTTNGGPYIIATNLTVLTWINGGLSNGTTYYFVVSATNPAGESANSIQASARPVSLAPPQVAFSVSGSQIQLTWPLDHMGWELQVQTNPPNTGLGTDWVTVPNSNLTNQFSTPIGTTNGSVFYRLTYP
jgi:alpha-L-fucosidase